MEDVFLSKNGDMGIGLQLSKGFSLWLTGVD